MSAPVLPPLPDDIVAQMNAQRGGFNETLGLLFVRVTYEELVAEIPVGPHLHQPYGLVHGGVYASIVETVASTGAALHSIPNGRSVVGLENTTSFLRAVRQGVMTARGTPMVTGRRSQVWEVAISGDDGRVAATGRVRLLCLEAGSVVSGEAIKMKTESNQ